MAFLLWHICDPFTLTHMWPFYSDTRDPFALTHMWLFCSDTYVTLLPGYKSIHQVQHLHWQHQSIDILEGGQIELQLWMTFLGGGVVSWNIKRDIWVWVPYRMWNTIFSFVSVSADYKTLFLTNPRPPPHLYNINWLLPTTLLWLIIYLVDVWCVL